MQGRGVKLGRTPPPSPRVTCSAPRGPLWYAAQVHPGTCTLVAGCQRSAGKEESFNCTWRGRCHWFAGICLPARLNLAPTTWQGPLPPPAS